MNTKMRFVFIFFDHMCRIHEKDRRKKPKYIDSEQYDVGHEMQNYRVFCRFELFFTTLFRFQTILYANAKH